MPTFLLTAWPMLKRALPYLAIALAVASTWAWIDHNGYQRGAHSRDAEVTALTLRASTAEASVKTLRAAIDSQNAEVTALHVASDARTKAAAEALGAAVEREKASQGLVGRLRASAAVRPAGGACPVSEALASVGGEGL